MQIIEKIVEILEVLTDQGTQTSESLGTAPVRHVRFAEIVEMVGLEPPLPAEYVAPAPVMTYAARASEVELNAPAPVMTNAAPASEVELIAPAKD